MTGLQRTLRRRFATALGCLVALVLFAGQPPVLSSADELGAPTGTDRQVAQIVARLMQNDHLSSRPLDDDMSVRAMGLFLNSLDPMKLYFYQSDIDEFNVHSDELDDMVKRGELDLPIEMFQRYLDRVDERLMMIDDLLAGEFDFTVDEEMITDPELVRYPKTPEEARDRWRQRLKYNLLVLKTEETVGAEAVEKLQTRYRSFSRRMNQFDAQEVVEMFITAVTSSFDPHTTYMSKRTYENFLIQMRLNLEGIGASLQNVDGATVIKRIVRGGAADRDGRLQVEDTIVSVGQEDEEEMIDVAEMKLDDVVEMIRGPAGTVVRLGVIKAGSDEMEVYEITRERIELKDSEAQGEIFEHGTKADGTPFRLGVIDLPSFYADMDGARQGVDGFKSTTADVEAILEDFKAQEVDAVVLDLRQNPGGSLEEAINLTGLFIDYGPVVQVKDAYGQVRPLYDEQRGTAWDGPLVVMTSKFSASASEILAGAIQDYGRGIVVGDESTHGKGTVQSLVNLGGILFRIPNPPRTLGALKITMQQFYRPGGDSTQLRGVLADIVLPSISNYMDVGEEHGEYPVEFDRVREADFDELNMVSANLIARLRDASDLRRAESQEFQDLLADIELYREQKSRQSVTLNEERFFERRRELDAQRRDEETILDQINNDDPSIELDFYLNEVLSITVDYLQALANNEVARVN